MINCSSVLTAANCSKETFDEFLETKKKNTKKNHDSLRCEEMFRKQQAGTAYNDGLEILWGSKALEKLRFYVKFGKITKINIENIAKFVNHSRTFEKCKELDPVDLFERLLEVWYDEDLFELNRADAQRKLSLAMENCNCVKRVKTDIRYNLSE